MARHRLSAYRGSMAWSASKGVDYLLRSSYDASGKRVQHSLGRRSATTEVQKQHFDEGRVLAQERMDAIRTILNRQAAVNRAVALGRVPSLSARIMRAVDDAGLLGQGLRVAGTHALYAYEAIAGVFLDAAITTTEDIDFLQDSRTSLRFSAAACVEDAGMIGLLKRLDKSFERGPQSYRAINKDGFFVDLIKPVPNPPWKPGVAPALAHDLEAIEIEGLAWLENAPSFEAVAIDATGMPCRIIAVDPRVFAAHKFWVSQRLDREPAKRMRDLAQARVVAALATRYFSHLPYDADDLRMLPLAVFETAVPLFAARRMPDDILAPEPG